LFRSADAQLCLYQAEMGFVRAASFDYFPDAPGATFVAVLMDDRESLWLLDRRRLRLPSRLEDLLTNR
jgi:hypothetical protein